MYLIFYALTANVMKLVTTYIYIYIYVCVCVHTYIHTHTYIRKHYIQSVSGGIVNILGGGSMNYFE